MKLLADPRVILAGAIVLGAALIAMALIVVPALDDGAASTQEDPCKGLTGDQLTACRFSQAFIAPRNQPSSTQSENWWVSDSAQTLYTFLGFAISAGGGGYAYWRVRARRQRLHEYVRRIEDAVSMYKASPREGSAALALLRQELRDGFRAGRVDDAHFLELDKRATAAILKLRLMELDQRFPVIPPTLRTQVVTLIGDGTVSDAEVHLVRSSLASQLIPGRVREDLLALLAAWAEQDSGAPDAIAPPLDAAAAGAPDEVLVRVKDS